MQRKPDSHTYTLGHSFVLHVNEAMKQILLSYGPENCDHKFEIKYKRKYMSFIYLFVVHLITISAAGTV